MIINKNISDKTFFLLTNYNDPNLFQFHLPFLNLMPYALKNVSPVHNFIKKRVTSSIVDMVMVANCYKLSLLRVLNFQSVPSKSGVFLYIFKKLVLTPWTNSLREIEVSSQKMSIFCTCTCTFIQFHLFQLKKVLLSLTGCNDTAIYFSANLIDYSFILVLTLRMCFNKLYFQLNIPIQIF